MITASLLVGLLSCGRAGKPGAEEIPTVPTETTDGGGASGTDGGGGDGGGAAPELLRPVPTSPCPPPPEGARVFSAGTVIADQSFVYADYEGRSFYYDQSDWQGWALIATGLSYVHEDRCYDLAYMNHFDRDVKQGRANGQLWFELAVHVPGTTVDDWLGVHPQGSGDMKSRVEANHLLTIGWRDEGDLYPRFVSALPQGWTRSEVCVGTVSPDYVYLTVLWDPAEGPYRTNDWTRTDQPIWFDVEIWRTVGGDPSDVMASKHRSCMSTSWWFYPDKLGRTSADELFTGYTWPGKHE